MSRGEARRRGQLQGRWRWAKGDGKDGSNALVRRYREMEEGHKVVVFVVIGLCTIDIT